jgi:AcrR family transcriptional regulator
MAAFMERGFAATTMLEIATRARVSKRELYTLVGNKDEMLAICVADRGKRMRLPEGFPSPTSRESLRSALHTYGTTMLREVLDPKVIAVFRLGIAESTRSPRIGRSIHEMGREPSRVALRGLLQAAQAERLIADGDVEVMVSRYHALLWGDLMVWILLGTAKPPTAKEMERRAEEAVSLFLALYGC